MSVINKMLQDLDKRDAMHEPRTDVAAKDGGLAQQVRPVRAETLSSNLFWGSLAALILAVLAWAIWIMWQIMPRPLVTDQALQFLSQARPPPGSAPAVAPEPASVARKVVRVDTAEFLRMATEIVTPIGSLSPNPVRPVKFRDSDRIAVAQAQPRDDKETGPDLPGAATGAPSSAPAPRAMAAAPAAGRIDKRADATPRERADAEFRRAMSLVNQGRMAEGMDALGSTLSLDASHETARQTLVALLLEARRIDEAAGLLQQGLAVNPDNVGYAMLLARIYVERGDPQRALALLQKSEPAGRGKAEFQAFVAALYQRVGRHVEAVDRYQGALRLSAGVGAWWVGLGISQEALDRRQEAAESFARAKAAGNLDAELVTFVDLRLKQLR